MLLGLLRAGATVGGYGFRGGKAFLRTPGMGYLGRPLTGMVGGGLYGAFQGEEGTDATMMAQGAMGAALGLAGGLLALPGGFRAAGRALSPVGRLMGGLVGVGSRAVKPGLAQKANSFGFNPNAALPYAARLAGRAGIGLGKLAINHPRPMLYGGLGIAAAVAMNDRSPDMNRIAAIPQSRASMAEGVELPGGVKGMGMPAAQLPANFSSMPNSHTSLRRLQDSTAGLVFGMHNGRHRGG